MGDIRSRSVSESRSDGLRELCERVGGLGFDFEKLVGAQTAFRRVLAVANIPIHLPPSLVEQAACFDASTLHVCRWLRIYTAQV
jgi:hypothetical protein